MLYAIIKHLSVSLLKVSFEGFPPLSATLASGVKYNTLPCRSSIELHQDFISDLTMTLLRVSPAPAPRSILVKKVTFQRREGESSSGSRLETTSSFFNPIPIQQWRQPWCKSVRLSGHGQSERRHRRHHRQGATALPEVFCCGCKDYTQGFIRQESDRFSALDPLL